MKSRAIFYFGCWGGLGHFLWMPGGRMGRVAGPFEEHSIDGKFCGDPALGEWRYGKQEWTGDSRSQPQGKARLAHVEHRRLGRASAEPWTVLAFWDRTCDVRYGSNSAFIAEGTLSAAEIAALAAEAFPAIWARIQTIPGGLVLPVATARGAEKEERS